MSAPPIVKATLQAALINASSNVVAQAITAYKAQKPFRLDFTSLVQFTACAVIMTPFTYLWINNLESTFPAFRDEDPQPKKTDEKKDGRKKQKLNIKNTIAKVVLDQTVGAAWNTVLFLTTMGILRGQDSGAVVNSIQNDFWPIMIAGFKMWPLVSILCFTVVPADKRLLVGSLFGFVWAIYLSIMSS
ncbi:hypothetical protein VTN77DRAFT_5420 [Rasamsonia byssochlamydoides]|uniref:uncharacterized protein n=1 Tax=Rasamsonia byssochlamydoides TaxID=89139 RepID=UPI0037428676